MKKRIYLAAMVLCTAMTFSACDSPVSVGMDKSTETGKEEKTSKKEESSIVSGQTRLVSVEHLEDYLSLSEYKGIEIEKSDTEVTEEEVSAKIQQILKENRGKTGSKAAVQNGDLVTLNYVGTIDGKPFENNMAYYYDVVIGEGEMFSELEEGILGMKKGETKTVTCTYPLDYENEEVAGKEAVFTITIQSIRRVPELTDKWVKENTEFETAEAYTASVREALEAETEEKIKLHVWQTILTNSEVLEYPEKDLENAAAAYKRQISLYAEQAELELETFIESQGITMDEFEAQCQQYAEKKVKQNLVVQAIMDQEGFSLDDEESLAIQDELMESYQAESLADFVDQYSQTKIDESIGLLRVEEFIYKNIHIIEEYAETSDAEKMSDTEAAE